MTQDIRWQQRFSNYRKALAKLNQAVEIIKNPPEVSTPEVKEALENIFKVGLIQSFEFTHELAWNVMKDYAAYQGNNQVAGSRDATREAYRMKLIDDQDSEKWMEMLKSRNLASHTYNEETADEIEESIIQSYYPLFLKFEKKMESLRTVVSRQFLEKNYEIRTKR
jgi:nucleotidyltransferase substrate binding protein (TIGR01987 family)